MTEPHVCPFCDGTPIDGKPVCPTHWQLTDATVRVNFYAAYNKLERAIYRGDSVDEYSRACDAAVDMVRERLESQEANA
jgi:hypothetical protein